MPLPLKRYHYLKELAERWGVSMSDLVDYCWNGELEIAIMTIAQSVELGRVEGGVDGQVEVRTEDTVLFGAQPLLVADVCSIFRAGVYRISRFKPRTADGYLKITDGHPSLTITTSDLLVTRLERDRFEAAHGLVFAEPSPTNARSIFEHREDYSEVVLHNQLFRLGPLQATIVRRLHEASSTSNPWRNGRQLLADTGARTERLVDLFKGKTKWRDLIASNGRGCYRLNVPEPFAARATQRVFRRLRLVHVT